MTITVDDLKAAKMRAGLFLDGAGFYENHSYCVEYPRLTRVKRGPSGRRTKDSPQEHRMTLYVDGIEVPADLQAIADALNATTSATP